VTRAEAERRATGEDPTMKQLQEMTSKLVAIEGELARLRRGGLPSA